MIGHRAPFWSATLFLTTLLICLFGADYALDHPQAATPDGEPLNAVYFTDGYSAVLTVDRARALGMRPVATARALQDEGESADAIIIDRPMLRLVPPRWLAQQYRQGKLILGLNIPIAELARIAEYDGGVGGYLERFWGIRSTPISMDAANAAPTIVAAARMRSLARALSWGLPRVTRPGGAAPNSSPGIHRHWTFVRSTGWEPQAVAQRHSEVRRSLWAGWPWLPDRGCGTLDPLRSQ
jgi:hypothetical protein